MFWDLDIIEFQLAINHVGRIPLKKYCSNFIELEAQNKKIVVLNYVRFQSRKDYKRSQPLLKFHTLSMVL